jgi:hypothetical protein
MIKKIFLTIILSALMVAGYCQKITLLEVDLSKSASLLDEPFSIDLDAITFLPDTALSLVEIQGSKRIPIPFQIENKGRRTLSWIVKAGDEKVKKRTYELVKGAAVKNNVTVKAKVDDGTLTIQSNDSNLLRYQFKTVYPPAGIDTAFRRSAFIHPLWTPHGQPLTRIQAPDHYHHYGIWNPWTHVLFEGDTVDFWNLKGRKGTVRFGKFVSVTSGPVFAEFRALHEHVAFKKNGAEKIALNEFQTVRVYGNEKNQDYYFVDITIELNCASASPFLILEYRYAGLGWRATEKWNKTNSEVLTSEGKTRKESDGTTARWAIIQGALDADYGGAVMMSYPSNYNHPEPLRIWPEGSNAGEMFAMFAPTKTKDWLLEPGNTYTLKYRFVVFNGNFTKEKAESAWQYYSDMSTRVVVKK